VVELFRARVPDGLPDVCWPWKGSVAGNGYGRLKAGGVEYAAHRLAWEIEHGEMLGDRWACHHCDNKVCVNPAHIYAGDRFTNARDAVDRGLLVGNQQDNSGTRNPSAKLTAEAVTVIRSLSELGVKNTVIAARFGVSHSMVSRIKLGRSWNERPR
jgi:hypothetical protein